MTLTTTYTVTDQDGDSLEIEAEAGKVYVNPTTDLGLGLTIHEACDLIAAINRAIHDALDQEDESDEDDDDLDTFPGGWVEIGHTEPGSFFFAPVDEVENGQLYTAPKATTITFNVTNPPTASECAKRQLDLIADFID